MQSNAVSGSTNQAKPALGGQNMIQSLVVHGHAAGQRQAGNLKDSILVVGGQPERMKQAPAVRLIVPGTQCSAADTEEVACNRAQPKQQQPKPCKPVYCRDLRQRPASASQAQAARINPLLRSSSVDSFVQFDISVPPDQCGTAVHGQDHSFELLKQQWLDERAATRQEQATICPQACENASNMRADDFASKRTAIQDVEHRPSLESCAELTAAEVQQWRRSTAWPRQRPQRATSQPDRGVLREPHWKMYSMHLDVGKAPVHIPHAARTSQAGHFEVVTAQPQPVRPYRHSRPARPASALAGGGHRPARSAVAAILADESGPVATPGPSAAVDRVAARQRPSSAHARLTHTSTDQVQTASHGLVSKEARVVQQAASGLPNKATMRRSVSARARVGHPARRDMRSAQAVGTVVSRSAWSVVMTFDTPLCIAPAKLERPASKKCTGKYGF
eukprot:jgi/Ulvmu1/407/UM001_0414.1